MEVREKEVTDLAVWHSLTNSVLVGSYLRFMADGESALANAWLECSASFVGGEMPLRESGSYSKTPREVAVLQIRSMSEASDRLLRSRLAYVQEAVNEFSLDDRSGGMFGPSVRLVIADVVSPSAERRIRDILELVERSGFASSDQFQRIGSLLEKASFGWSVWGRQRVQHLALPDADESEIAELTTFLQQLNDKLWFNGKLRLETGEMNNISFASSHPGRSLLARAARNVEDASSRKKLRVGVIVPGGPAARSDIADLEEHPDIDAFVRFAYRDSPSFARQLTSAVYELEATCDVLLIAYGGGNTETLERVRTILVPNLEELTKPCWVAVGHASDPMQVSNEAVRVCRTPGDARTLFLAETVEFERKFRQVLLAAAGDAKVMRGDGSAIDRLENALTALRSDLAEKRQLHLQR